MSVAERMQNMVDAWETAQDSRAIFLGCYSMMTRNMLEALEGTEFHDPVWVRGLLHRFADYYFYALARYEKDSASAPQVWRIAFDATRVPGTHVLQNLILGVNAHINYDLVLTLVDVLQPEWDRLSAGEVDLRYADHCHINHIIGRTIDGVQDEILEKEEPALGLVDFALGPVDEWMTSHFIAHWREEVWENATEMLDLRYDDRERKRRQIELAAIDRANAILLREGSRGLLGLI